MISVAKYVWVGSIIANKLTLWCLFETVKSVFSKDLKNMVAKWKRRCSPKDLWSGFFVLLGSTENSLDLAQRDPGKLCGPLFPHIRVHRFLTLGLLAGLRPAELMSGWQSEECLRCIEVGVGRSFQAYRKLKQFLYHKYKIQILYDKHAGSVCEFVNLIQIRTLGVRV